MKILIISSEHLYPENLHFSSFELAQAKALLEKGANVDLLSVFMCNRKDIFKAFLFKLFLPFKKNIYVHRFSVKDLWHLLLQSIFAGKPLVINHHIEGVSVTEAIGISSSLGQMVPQYIHDWTNAGYIGYKEWQRKKGEPGIIHAHSRFYLAIALAAEIKKKTGTPYFITEHSSFYFRDLIPAAIFTQLRQAYQQANGAVAVSRALKLKVEETLSPDKEIGVVYNMLPAEFEQAEINTQKPAGPFEIICVGRLDKNKNQALLINAFQLAQLSSARLHIVGEGEDDSFLRQMVNKLNLQDAVIFWGQQPQSKVKELISKCHVLVVSSLVETFSVVTIEAHACGVPVISTCCGGPEELINHENGILLPDFEIKTMAQALLEIKNNYQNFDPASIRMHCLTIFSSSSIADKLMSVYQMAINTTNE